jgi:2-oxoglutarate ferredoxin oxidoreductase subunit gamma
MYHSIIIAGFGGQGVMVMGRLLAQAGVEEGRHVTWIPSYGPEMRGGAANCTVVLSSDEVGSPIVSSPMTVIAMNKPALDKFEPRMKTGGVMVINTSMVKQEPTRGDINILKIPAMELAKEMEDPSVYNLIALGAMIEKTKIVQLNSAIHSLEEIISKRRQHLLLSNAAALRKGAEFVISLM